MLGSGRSISDGDTTPSTTDGTDFGTVDVASGSVTRTFFAKNVATAGTLSKLGVSGISLSGPDAASFQLTVSGLPARLSEGQQVSFMIVFDPSSISTKRATIVVASNDTDENPYEIAIQGTGTQGAPEIAVSGKDSREIYDTDDTPSDLDGTDLGAVLLGQSLDVRFRLRNDGGAPLLLTGNPIVRLDGGSQSEDFRVITMPNGSIPANSRSGGDLVIRFTPTVADRRDAIVTIKTNDSTGGEDVFTFRIRGYGTTGIVVEDPNGQTVANGSAVPIDLGTYSAGAASVPFVFKFSNGTPNNVTIVDVQLPGGVELAEGLPGTVPSFSFDQFTLELKTDQPRPRNPGDVTIRYRLAGSNNTEEFRIKVTGEVSAPVNVDVAYEGRRIIDNDSAPLALGNYLVGATQNRQFTFIVTNNGPGLARFSQLTLPAGLTVIDGLGATLAARASDTVIVELDTAVARSLRGAITFVTNDADPARQLFQINVSASITDPSAAAPGVPAVQLNSPNNGAFAVGDTVTFRGSATHPAGISHVQVELYQDGITPAHRIGIIHLGKPGDGNLESLTWTIPATLEGRVLGGRNYKIKWVAWSDENVPQPAADFSDGTFTIDASHVAQPTFAAPWGGGPFNYYNSRSFYYDGNHLGADILRNEGAAIQAGVQGVIKFYGSAPGYGNLLAVIEVDLGSPQTFTNALGNPVTTQKVLWILGHLRKSQLNGGGGQVLTWEVGNVLRPTDTIGFIERDSDNGDGAEHLHVGLRLQSFDAARTTDGGKFARGYEDSSGMGMWFANPVLPLNVTPSLPATPRGFAVSSVGPDFVSLTWTGDPNATGFILYRSLSLQGPWTPQQQIYRGPASKYDDTNEVVLHLDPGTSYYYRVGAFNSVGDSDLATPLEARTLATTVPAPSNLVGNCQDSPRAVMLTWPQVAGANRYVVERRTGASGPFAKIATVNSPTTSFTDAGQSVPQLEYTYRIRAAIGGVLSGPSPVAMIQFPGAVQPIPVGPAAPPVLRDESLDVVRLFRWSFDIGAWVDTDPSRIQWSGQRHVILTHGWDDFFGVGQSSEYIQVFGENFQTARNLLRSAGREDLDNMELLAIDWFGATASPAQRNLGSNPNGIEDTARVNLLKSTGTAVAKAATTALLKGGNFAVFVAAFLSNIADVGLETWVDAQESAENGIRIGRSLAPVLFNAGLNKLDDLMLIGHSNGAGLMASLATELHRLSTRAGMPASNKVNELVALDAPWLTPSTQAVSLAASSVNHVSNYYLPLFDYSPVGNTGYQFFEGSLAFGIPLGANATNVNNYRLSIDVSDQRAPGIFGHSQVPLRYAQSVRPDHVAPEIIYTHVEPNPWGFKTSTFVQGGRGDSTSVIHVEDDTIVTGTSAGAFTDGAALDSLFVRMASALGEVGINAKVLQNLKEMWDLSGTLEDAVGDNVEAAAFDIVDRLYNLKSQSPAYVVINVPLPANARAVEFHLDVLQPGNMDVLQVGMNGDLLGTIDLNSVYLAGGGDFRFWINEYAGHEAELAFYMPSDSPSDAQFVVSGVRVATSFSDDTGPTLTAAPLPSASVVPFTTLTLEFNEPIDEATVSNLANYQLSGPSGVVNISSATLNPDSYSINLAFAAGSMPPGAYTFRIFGTQGLADLSGNPFNDGQDYSFSFDVVAAPKVEGVVWKDENGDGVRQGGEMRFAGANVHLVEAATGTRRASAVTGPDGSYSIPAQLNTNYFIEVELPAGQRFTAADQGGDDAVDSDVNYSSGRSPTFSFSASGQVQSLDAGLIEVAGQNKLDLLVTNHYGATAYGLFGDGMGGFSAPATLGATNGAAAVEDFNEDGAPDLILIDAGSSLATLRFGLGSSQFGNGVTFAAGEAGASIFHATQADLNKDGHLDLIANGNGSNKVYVHLGRGDGTFAPFASYAVSNNPRQVAVGDFNADGWPDLATGNDLNGNNASVLMNLGNGTFGTATHWSMGLSPRGIVAADFNGDGRADIATSNQFSGSVTVRLSQASGGFGAVDSVSAPARALIAYDFDGDLDIDLATADEGNNVTVLINNGAGVFTAQPAVHPVSHAFHLAAGDFNGDGRGDLAVTDYSSNITNYSSSSLAVMYGNGTGGFSSTANFPVTNGTYVFAAELNGTPQFGSVGDFVWSDLDGDGIQDAGEPGLPGVTVNLRDPSDAIFATTITDAAGAYRFARVPSGDYRIEVMWPEQYYPSPQHPAAIGPTLIDLGGNDEFFDAVRFPDGSLVLGKVLNVGGNDRIGIQRLTAKGELDPSFGSNGRVEIDVGASGRFFGVDIVAQADGKIVFGGSEAANRRVVLFRLNSDGTVDNSFGGGIVRQGISGSSVRETLIALQSDGSVIVAGIADGFFAIRITSQGLVDGTFASGGTAFIAASNGIDLGMSSVLIAEDDSILMGGFRKLADDSDTDFFLVKLDQNGQRENGFGSNGVVITDFGVRGPHNGLHDSIVDLAIDSLDRIIAVGTAQVTPTVRSGGIARYLPNGALDSSFDGDGRVLLSTFGNQGLLHGWVLPDDRIVVVGDYPGPNGDADIGVARLLTNGMLDQTFSQDGISTFGFGFGWDYARSSWLLPTGFLAIAAIATGSTGIDLGLVTFGPDGEVVQDESRRDSDIDPVTGRSALFAVKTSVAITDVDAGLVTQRRIAGTAWDDRDGDGLRDVGEALSANVAVSLLHSTGNIVANTITGAEGRYLFDKLPPGSFRVEVTVPSGFRLSPPNQGSDDSIDSDVDPVTRRTGDFPLDIGVIPDPTFGIGGLVTTDVGSDGFAYDTVVQADGKILAVGNVGSDLVLVRYNPDGSLDTSFGVGGKVITALGSARAIALQADGKIVVAGGSDSGTWLLVRYDTNGDLDLDFGTGGKVLSSFGDTFESAFDVVLQPDGKIVAVGYAGPSHGNYDFVVARYNADGSFDGSFGTGGKVVKNINTSDVAWSVALQPDGKIIAAGRTGMLFESNDAALVRLNPDGSFDNSFGSGGIVVSHWGGNSEGINSIVLQPDGKIVAGGNTNRTGTSQFALARFLSNGSLDTTFGTNGTLTTDLVILKSLALQANGQIVATGITSSGGSGDHVAVARFNSNGSLDDGSPSDSTAGDRFGANGRIITDLIDGSGLAIQDNGKMIVAGAASVGGGLDFGVVRLVNPVTSVTADVGLMAVQFLGDRVWEDLNGDGRQDENEPAIDRVAVEAYSAGGDGMLGTRDDILAASTASDSFGAYHFSNLADGQYRLVFTPPAGFVPTQANAGEEAGDSDIDPDPNKRWVTVDLAGDHELRDVDAGFYRPGVIRGQKWNDLDGDGQHDSNEPGLNGWSIELRNELDGMVATAVTANLDANDDGVIDPVSERGWYTFSNLPPGVYHVSEVQQQGWLQTFPLPEETLLADDFNDNSLDASKWFVTLPRGNSSVNEAGGRLEIRNRGYLISQQQFDPREYGELRMTGRWKFTNASFPGHDYPQIFTRSDGMPFGTASETLNGIQFHINGNDSVAIVEAVNGNDVNLTGFVPFTVNDGDEFEFEARDDGTNLRFTVTRVSDGNTITLTAQSSHVYALNHVVIHNRETDTLGYLDDFRLTAGGTAYTVFLESGGQDSGRHFGNQALPGAAPVVDLNGGGDGTGFSTTFTENSPAVAVVGADATVTDVDSQFLRSLTATIANLADGAAELLDADTTGTALAKSYAAGVLTIAGIGSVADYQHVLRTLTYRHGSENPTAGERTIHVVASDGLHEGLATVATVVVTAVNDRPAIAAPAAISVDQGVPTSVLNVSVSDLDLSAVDAIDVTIAALHGSVELGFTGGLEVVGGVNGGPTLTVRGVWPDLNTALALLSYTSDANFGGEDTLTITVDDRGQFGIPGALTAVANIPITVIPSNRHSPVFTSSSTPSVAENGTAVLAVTASDDDFPAQTVTYTLTGGADREKFLLSSDGLLRFVNPPDFENPGDADGNNAYLLQITASDGEGGTTVQSLVVFVTGVNDHFPLITSSASRSVAENFTAAVITVTATDADRPGQAITYSLTGGADQGKFSISSSGVLTFITAPDYENPSDADGNNVYLVQVAASDGAGGSTTQDFAVTVTGVNDNSPVFTSSATPSLPENSATVVTLAATDADRPTQTISFAIAGGADQGKFFISVGQLKFVAAPDFEAPADADRDNVYEVQVRASDGAGGTTVQTLLVSVTGVNDNAPVFTSSGTPSVAENMTAVVVTVAATDADRPIGPIYYSLSGGVDRGKFSMTNGGVLTFNSAPDFENPTDADGNNTYLVQVTASDGAGGSVVQNVTVTVTGLNDNVPVFTSSATASVAENFSAVITVTATDADRPVQTISFSIAGGADQAKFKLVGGQLQFIAAPDFETPADADGDNVYIVDVQASDGAGGTARQTIRATVSNVNDPQIINRVLTILGTPLGDSFTISLDPGNLIRVVQSLAGGTGTEHRFPLAAVDLIDVTAGDGNDSVFVSQNVPLPTFIDGGGGNDFLRGSNHSNLILGGGGDDQIHGGNARDVLIGGAGSDVVYGYGEDDVLIGAFANNTRAELDALRTAWLTTQTFAVRSANVRAMARPVAAAGADVLIGSTGNNLTITPPTAGAAAADEAFIDPAIAPFSIWPTVADANDQAALLATMHPLIATNPFEALDLNGDGRTSPLDALVSINDINTYGARALFVYADNEFSPGVCNLSALTPSSLVPGSALALGADCNVRGRDNLFLDANLDDLLSPLDVILIVNSLNEIYAANGTPEGEAKSVNEVPTPYIEVSPISARKSSFPITLVSADRSSAVTCRTDGNRDSENSHVSCSRDELATFPMDTSRRTAGASRTLQPRSNRTTAVDAAFAELALLSDSYEDHIFVDR